ncbi:hypothetical protein B0T21DRAFT_444209 [Apiosordaria backusii]|uniref:Uncharacterized protein n=1 Tax=Apiosordaria backusii TaxID=314023 RepID=A0AA40BF51_9PEZI|nr:hypothetical protein B0T21DRAFT_444209 [Apiosordaria backusii]
MSERNPASPDHSSSNGVNAQPRRLASKVSRQRQPEGKALHDKLLLKDASRVYRTEGQPRGATERGGCWEPAMSSHSTDRENMEMGFAPAFAHAANGTIIGLPLHIVAGRRCGDAGPRDTMCCLVFLMLDFPLKMKWAFLPVRSARFKSRSPDDRENVPENVTVTKDCEYSGGWRVFDTQAGATRARSTILAEPSAQVLLSTEIHPSISTPGRDFVTSTHHLLFRVSKSFDKRHNPSSSPHLVVSKLHVYILTRRTAGAAVGRKQGSQGNQ